MLSLKNNLVFAYPCVLLELLIIQNRLEQRPEVFSYLFFTIFLYVIQLWKQNKAITKKQILSLILIEIMWVNSHGLFPLGIALVGLWMLTNPFFTTKVALVDFKKSFKIYLPIIALLLLATFISPLGYKTWDSFLKQFYVLGDFQKEVAEFKTNAGFNKKSEVQGGMVTFIQRFGSALNLNIHAHILTLDGVFEDKSTGRMKFYTAKAPTDEDVVNLIGKISRRINKYLVKTSYLEERDADLVLQDTTNLFEQDDLHLPSMAASLASKIAFGENQGKPVKRLYTNWQECPNDDHTQNKGERCAVSGGYSLRPKGTLSHTTCARAHANTAIKAPDRERLKQLIGYMARPAISEDRLEIISDNRIRIKLKSCWSDGTTHLELRPLETIEKLMALIPLPYFHLTRYFGILSPHAKHRHQIVPLPKDEPNAEPNKENGKGNGARKKKYIPWAELLKKTFSIDILKCSKCGGKMIVEAVIKDPPTIKLILIALGLAPKPPDILPARPTSVFSQNW